MTRRVVSRRRSSMLLLLAIITLLIPSSSLVTAKETISLKLNDLGSGLEALGDLFQGLAGAAKQKQDGTCPSVCDGHVHEATWSPAPKPRIRPYSNGCSVPASLRDSLRAWSTDVREDLQPELTNVSKARSVIVAVRNLVFIVGMLSSGPSRGTVRESNSGHLGRR